MHDRGKSDGLVVPAKLPNNPVSAGAEVVEGRSLPEGNTASETRAGLRTLASQRPWSGIGRCIRRRISVLTEVAGSSDRAFADGAGDRRLWHRALSSIKVAEGILVACGCQQLERDDGTHGQ